MRDLRNLETRGPELDEKDTTRSIFSESMQPWFHLLSLKLQPHVVYKKPYFSCFFFFIASHARIHISTTSHICCHLYCYECAAWVTILTATTEWYFFWYSLVLMILSYEPSISSCSDATHVTCSTWYKLFPVYVASYYGDNYIIAEHLSVRFIIMQVWRALVGS